MSEYDYRSHFNVLASERAKLGWQDFLRFREFMGSSNKDAFRDFLDSDQATQVLFKLAKSGYIGRDLLIAFVRENSKIYEFSG